MKPAGWRQSTLGELCEIVKGSSAISRTQPGAYPLVTTGEDRKTADHYQFDCEAVCVPMISSTGHGHASLKRVHYQTGKFALANLLSALLVKDPSQLSPRFLALFLNYYKDALIVPLMVGAANMSLTISRLAGIPVCFPSLDIQQGTLGILDNADNLCKLRREADRRTADLIPALFHEMFVMATGPGACEHIPLGDAVYLVNGRAFKPSEWSDCGVPIVRIQNLKQDDATFNYFDGAYAQQHHVSNGDVLLSWSGQLVSFGAFIWGGPEGVLNQHIFNVKSRVPLDRLYLCQALNRLIDSCKHQFNGIEMKHLTKRVLNAQLLPLPPLPLQQQFAAAVVDIRAMQDQQQASRRRLDDLYQSLLHRAFRGEL